MKLHVLLAVSFSWAVRQGPTYRRQDPITNEVYQCEQCPPGTALWRHCGPGTPTVCAPCPARQFSEQWHWGDACQHCTAVCKERQFVRQECNLTQDRLCQCLPGHYLEVEFCVRHTACPPGSGVTVLGTPETNTVCGKCPKGSFSSVASATEPCVPHRNCSGLGMVTVRPGTTTQNAVCEKKGKDTPPGCFQPQVPCHTDAVLCEEAIFQVLSAQRLALTPLDALLVKLPGQKVERKSVEWIKKKCSPKQQVLQLIRLWLEKNKDQEKLFGIIRGVNHCKQMVSRSVAVKNLSLGDLKALRDSLPGVQVGDEDVREAVDSCRPQQRVLRLLHVWGIQNAELDLPKALAHSLHRLRDRDVPLRLLRGIRKLSRILTGSSIHKTCEKIFSDVGDKRLNSKWYND